MKTKECSFGKPFPLTERFVVIAIVLCSMLLVAFPAIADAQNVQKAIRLSSAGDTELQDRLKSGYILDNREKAEEYSDYINEYLEIFYP